MPLIWAFGGGETIVENGGSLFPLPPLFFFSPDLAKKAATLANTSQETIHELGLLAIG